MSRIHEALKRAEQEKAANPRPVAREEAARTTVAPVYEQPTSSNHVAEEVIRPRQTERVNERFNDRGTTLRYEDLVARCTHPEWKADSTLRASLAGEGGRVVGERFRTLRSRLYQIAGMRPLRRLLITSSMQGEGKTFIATNLVRSIIRQADKRVLLVDADLRAPRLHTALGAPSTLGLSDYLRGEADEFRILQNSETPNLCFIPCGTRVSNPSELLLSERMKVLLETLTPAFDWVIFDSPPSLPVHDASSLADLCDGVLFVIRAGETSYEVAKKAASEFRDKNLIGVVMNQVDKSEGRSEYYYNAEKK
jgi:protein-tyrosine kinase